ncbi:MAG: DUF1349 domain-containing protein, partial [Candidatus Omnitrophica bacterium]|nr:DUF1349 domain-containing protein [Candidatus Omnitrophota bacterium]
MRKNEGLMTIVVVAIVIFALMSVAVPVGAAAEVNHLSVDGAWVLKETIKDPVVLGKESKDYYNFHGGISEYSGYYSYDWTSQSRDSKGNVIDTFCTGQVHLQSNWTTPPSTLVPGQTMKTDVEASFTSSHEDIKGHFTCDRKRIGGQCAKLTVTGRGFVPIKRGTCVDGYTKELSKKSSETIEWLVPQGIHGDTLEIIFHPFTTGMAGSMWNTGIHFIYEYKEESSTTTPAWCDYFDSATLDPRWSWEREDPTHWSLTERPGYLRITTQRCDLYQAHNTAKNLLLTPAPSGDFEVTTHVTINPSANYQAATLFVYQDDDNHLTLSRQYASMWGGQQVFFCKEVEGWCDAPHGVPDGCDLTTVYLKITKQGTTYTGYWSTDGSSWTKVYQYKDIKFSNLKIGCIGWHGESSAAEIPADFDYICVAPIGAVPTPTPTPTPTPAPTPAPTLGKLKKCVG